MEQKKIDEISSKVLSRMASVKAVNKMVEDLVEATTELGLSQEERREYIIEITKDVNPEWVLKFLAKAEKESALGGKQEIFN